MEEFTNAYPDVSQTRNVDSHPHLRPAVKRLKQEKHDLEAGLSYTPSNNNNNKAQTLTVSALCKLAELEKNVKDDYVHADTLR